MLITKWQRARITAVMALVFVAEHADMMILSAMYLPISRTLHIGVAKLGTLSMYRGIVSVSVHAFPSFVLHSCAVKLSPYRYKACICWTCSWPAGDNSMLVAGSGCALCGCFGEHGEQDTPYRFWRSDLVSHEHCLWPEPDIHRGEHV